MHRFATWGATAVLALGTAGCSHLSPDAAAAGSTAQRFHQAITDGDGKAACDLLAPHVVEQFESDSGRRCPAAIIDAEVPAAAQVRSERAIGREAQVVLDGDVVFLTDSHDRWLVTGAGCTPRPGLPYDCKLAGG